jgi:thioesterase domain-containing protein/acyl carrier protein
MPARTAAPDPVPIGRAVPNSYVYVLDEHGLPLPPGVAGELHVAGDGLALGYRNQPDATAARFVTPKFGGVPGERLYRTGDLARMRGDGVVEFLGRIDRQVKVRGFRVEPEAVEHELVALPAVREAVVVPWSTGPDDLRLAAYLVPADDSLSIDEARQALASRLPTHEVPAQWVVLDAIPLTSNGKVDRDALPPPTAQPDDDAPAPTGQPAAPDALEQQMLGIWADVLSVGAVQLDDDFFDLGGHSLLAVELFARVEHDIGPRLPLATIFEAPTPHELVAAVRAEGWAAPWDPIVALNTEGDRVPFFCCAAGDGNTVGYGALARHLPADQPFYGLQPSGLDGRTLLRTSVPSMARRFVAAVRRVRPHGPYLLGGRCLGGLVAYEMARQLEANGEDVALVAVLDSLGPRWVARELVPGVPFDEVMNLAVQRSRAGGDDLGDVHSAAGAARLLEWLREPAVDGAPAVNRYLYEAYLSRPDVQAAYPDLAGGHAAGLIGWAWSTGRHEMGLEPALLPPGPAAASRGSPGPGARTRAALERAGERALDHLDVATRGRIRRFRGRRLSRLQQVAVEASLAYRAPPYGGTVTLVRTEEFLGNVEVERWHGVDAAAVEERMVFGSHRSMLREPDVASLASTLQECIDDALVRDSDRRVASEPTTNDDR